MSRTRAQRRLPAMTADRAGGGEAGARGLGAPPPPASPPPAASRAAPRRTWDPGPSAANARCANPPGRGQGPTPLYQRVRYPGAEARPAPSPAI